MFYKKKFHVHIELVGIKVRANQLGLVDMENMLEMKKIYVFVNIVWFESALKNCNLKLNDIKFDIFSKFEFFFF